MEKMIRVSSITIQDDPEIAEPMQSQVRSLGRDFLKVCFNMILYFICKNFRCTNFIMPYIKSYLCKSKYHSNEYMTYSLQFINIILLLS